MQKSLFFLLLFACTAFAHSQQSDITVIVKVSSEGNTPLYRSTVALLKPDSLIFRTAITDSTGTATFLKIPRNSYLLHITMSGFLPVYTRVNEFGGSAVQTLNVTMTANSGNLETVLLISKKPFVQFLADRTVVNVDAGITNSGATVLEVLEKSPGITVDKDGNISMKGRPSVLVMIDGKQQQLSGTDLQNLLNGMNASQVDVIELIDNPGARYDAAGNAGIINIRTKKNRQRGMNGTLSTSYGQGKYPKNNNSFIFNIREGMFNYYLTYSNNISRSFVKVDALRTYYDDSGGVEALLDQPYYNKSQSTMHTLRAGVDFFSLNGMTIGAGFTGTDLSRKGDGRSSAIWMDKFGVHDSSSITTLGTSSGFSQGGANLNFRQVFNEKKELSADVDLVGYELYNNQHFTNSNLFPGNDYEETSGRIPSRINIMSAKADFISKTNTHTWEAGWKSSQVNTDNLADYRILQNGTWIPDEGRSNHFLYKERIHALYSSVTKKANRWETQAGLRFEHTGFNARQLGNSIVKDSAFDRKYGNLFPTLFVSHEPDSVNRFIFRAGRRIDRPAFQKLNPFVIILNKYTVQEGNPFFRPQFTWNVELSHVYKGMLTTSLTYNRTTDYFSQLFYSDTATGLIRYSEGNTGQMENFGVSTSVQLSPVKWWSFTATAVYNHKMINGTLWKEYKAKINQVNFNMNNQFRFGKGWGAELSGFYLTRNQNDLQEVLDPTGQVSLGVSKQVLKGKGSLRFSARDLFYTQVMAGWTYFEDVVEYFTLLRDTRVATVTFTYRFGKAARPVRRASGAATEETQRVGAGN